MRLVYSESALSDLMRLKAFIDQNSPEAASRIALELVERIEKLLIFPLMGKPVALAPDPNIIRDMVFGKYIVRYAAYQEVIAILRIWHHAESRD
jgi:plasmid stabilization system protein ParE